jgi:di/tricarboxylate transporter
LVLFEIFPYRGPPVVSGPVGEVARGASPDVTPEIAPSETPGSDAEDVAAPEGPAPGAESAAAGSDAAADLTRETVLRGSDFMLGFGNEALITICLLLVLAKGVEVTGALRPVGRMLSRMWSFDRRLALLVTLAVGAFLSAFVNNTPVVVMMLPLLVGVAHRIGVPPSRILMPVGFATIVGGMSTTIGTSTNLLVTSVSRQLDGPEFAIFDFLLPASFAAAAGILYLWVLAPRMIPDRASPLAAIEPRVFRAVIRVEADSAFEGKTLAEVIRDLDRACRIERVQRGATLSLARLPSLVLRADDRLHVTGPPEALKRIQSAFGGPPADHSLHTPDQQLIEIVVTQTSPLHGKRLSELGVATAGKLSPVGLRPAGSRTGVPVSEGTDPSLAVGDLLLAQGRREHIRELGEHPDILVLDREIHVARTAKAPLAIALLLGVVLAAAFGIVSIMISALCGVALMLVGRCLAWDEAWRAIDTRLVFVIVTSLALGLSLSATGATEFLARSFVGAVQHLPAPVVVSSLLLATALLTEVVTNNAVAIIATPIALGVANQLGLPPTPFVLAVLFGANMSYMTPIGYQTNLLVLSAGGYRFADFARAGIPLQLLLWAVLSVALPVLYL